LILVTHHCTNAGGVHAELGIVWITPSQSIPTDTSLSASLCKPSKERLMSLGHLTAMLTHFPPLPPLTGSQGPAAQTLAGAAVQPPFAAVPWPADTERSDP